MNTAYRSALEGGLLSTEKSAEKRGIYVRAEPLVCNMIEGLTYHTASRSGLQDHLQSASSAVCGAAQL